MNQNASQFIGSIPKHYDNDLGPHIFLDYGDDLAARAAASGATEILETAAGTGIVSRKLRDAFPPHAALIVTDLNPPMLAVAEGKFREEENVTLQPADALSSHHGPCPLWPELRHRAVPVIDRCGTISPVGRAFQPCRLPDRRRKYIMRNTRHCVGRLLRARNGR